MEGDWSVRDREKAIVDTRVNFNNTCNLCKYRIDGNIDLQYGECEKWCCEVYDYETCYKFSKEEKVK